MASTRDLRRRIKSVKGTQQITKAMKMVAAAKLRRAQTAITEARPYADTLTTVLGLTPMALSWGEGAELRAPLAITVASGLILSTLLTLVIIPAAYKLVPSTVSSLEEDTK